MTTNEFIGVALLTGVAAKRAEQQQETKAVASNSVKPLPVALPVSANQVVAPAESANRAREQAKVGDVHRF
jgi:hypothetical protein